MNTRLLAALALLSGCGASTSPVPPGTTNHCAEEATTEALAPFFDFGEGFQRPGDYLVSSAEGDAATWYASARHAGGRVFLRLHPDSTSGTLPRSVVASDACTLSEAFTYRDDADGKLHLGTVTIAVLDGGTLQSNGIDFALTAMSFQRFDGGTSPLPDRRLTLGL